MNGYLNYEGEDKEGKSVRASVEVGHEERNGENVQTQLSFSIRAMQSTYRVIVSELVDAQIKTANFKGAKWDVEVMPQKSNQRLTILFRYLRCF